MDEIKFEKYGNGYKTTLPQNVIDAIKGIMIAISGDKINEYSPYLNNNLEDQIISRYVSSVFFSTEGVSVLDEGFVIIDVIYDTRQLKISTGKVIVGENKYELASGVVYGN